MPPKAGQLCAGLGQILRLESEMVIDVNVASVSGGRHLRLDSFVPVWIPKWLFSGGHHLRLNSNGM